MTLQFSTTFRNDFFSAAASWNTTLGASATLTIATGSPPANCGAGATGTLLVTIPLNATPFGAPSGGAAALNGLTLTANAGANGTAGYFRVLDSSSVCHIQGTVAQGGGDLSFDNATFVSGQPVNITGFTITAPGA